jgi:riboflavin synthase
MYTGLIERVGKLSGTTSRGNGSVLTLSHAPWESPLELGESVAVQGACLTVTSVGTGSFTADVLNETLQRTSLGHLASGAAVNLERALRVGDRFGGHMVSGHVDGCGQLAAVTRAGDDYLFRITCSEAISEEIVSKGSIALDGISLTIANEAPGWFEVAVIPHTWAHTSLPSRKPGNPMNLETDILGKYVRRYLGGQQKPAGLTMEHLARAGLV